MRVVSIGCDPELFLQDADGNIRSAIGKFGGTKEKPEPLKPLGEGFAVQEDNILVEFNIPPAKDPTEFLAHVDKTVKLLSLRAAKMGLSFANGSAYSVSPKELDHPKAKVFGCDPDFNAYTGAPNPKPRADDPNLRSAGGHIAFGFSEPLDDNGKRFAVAMMDMVLGLPSLLVDEGEKRKQLYGKAGAYRPKPFGVEYRTLSNFWLFKPKIIQALLTDFNRSITYHDAQVMAQGVRSLKHPFWDACRIAINTNNKDFAKDIIRAKSETFNNFLKVYSL